MLLYKIAEGRKRTHGIMFYHNRRKELGLPPQRMSTMDYMQYQKAFKKAKRNYNYNRGY